VFAYNMPVYLLNAGMWPSTHLHVAPVLQAGSWNGVKTGLYEVNRSRSRSETARLRTICVCVPMFTPNSKSFSLSC